MLDHAVGVFGERGQAGLAAMLFADVSAGVHPRGVVPGEERRAPSSTLRRIKSMAAAARSEEHTSELQSLMRISYAAFCLPKQMLIITQQPNTIIHNHCVLQY